MVSLGATAHKFETKGSCILTIRVVERDEVEVIVVQECCDVSVSRLVPINKLVSKVLDHHRRDPLLMYQLVCLRDFEIENSPPSHVLSHAKE